LSLGMGLFAVTGQASVWITRDPAALRWSTKLLSSLTPIIRVVVKLGDEVGIIWWEVEQELTSGVWQRSVLRAWWDSGELLLLRTV
jgi:hypothetical protein